MPNEDLQARPTPITMGEPAPDFTLRDQSKADWKLSDAVQKGDVVLCFFPLAFTGVCGVEMKCVSAEADQWQKKGAQVVGISCDSYAASEPGPRRRASSRPSRPTCTARSAGPTASTGPTSTSPAAARSSSA